MNAYFAPEDLVGASELREFMYCERAWFLSRQGYAVTTQAQVSRAAGVAFHEARAGAARKAKSNLALRSAIICLIAALALWLANRFLNLR